MREFEACTNSSREDQNDRVSVSDFNQSLFFQIRARIQQRFNDATKVEKELQ